MSRGRAHTLGRLAAAQAAGLVPHGQVTRVTVAHDSWCPGSKDPSRCRCIPDIVLHVGDDVLRLGYRGEVLERRQRT